MSIKVETRAVRLDRPSIERRREAKDRLYESLGGGRKRLDQLGYNAENGLTSQGNEPGRKKISEKRYDNEMRRTLTNGIAENPYARNGSYSSSRKAAKAGYKLGDSTVRGIGMAEKPSTKKKATRSTSTASMYEKAFGKKKPSKR